MFFKNKDLQVDYMPSEQIEKYLTAKLKEILGYEYTIFIRLSISQNWLDIKIDETSMTDKMYETFMDFQEKYGLDNGLGVFVQILKLQFGENYGFEFLVSDLKGVYVIRKCLY